MRIDHIKGSFYADERCFKGKMLDDREIVNVAMTTQ